MKHKLLFLALLISTLSCNKEDTQRETIKLNPNFILSCGSNYVSKQIYFFEYMNERDNFNIDRDTFEKGDITFTTLKEQKDAVSEIYINDIIVLKGNIYNQWDLNFGYITKDTSVKIKHVLKYMNKDSSYVKDSAVRTIYILNKRPSSNNYINKRFVLYNLEDKNDSILFKRSFQFKEVGIVGDTIEINNCKHIRTSSSILMNPYDFGFQTEYISESDFYLKPECEKFQYRCAFFYLDDKDKSIAYLKTWKYNYPKYKEDKKIYKGKIRQ